MLAVGAALGGLVAAVLGRDAAFLIDAASFAVSGVLIARIRRPFSADRTEEVETNVIRATRRDDPLRATRPSRARARHRQGRFRARGGRAALIAVFAHDGVRRGRRRDRRPHGGPWRRRADRAVPRAVARRSGRSPPLRGDRRSRWPCSGSATRRWARCRASGSAAVAVGYRAPRRRRAVDALVLRAAAHRSRPDPGTDLRVRLRAHHADARRVRARHRLGRGALRRRARR